MKKAKKQITLNDLAGMVAQGFSETGEKIDRLEARVGGIKGRMDGIEGKVGGIEGRMDGIEGRMNNLETGMDEVKTRTSRIEAKLDRALYKEIARLEEFIRQIARKIKMKLEY